MSWRALLDGLPDAVAAPDLPDAIAALEKVRVVLLRRYLRDGNVDGEPTPAPAPEPDQLLTVEEVAERLGVSVDYVYRNSASFPFSRRLSRKALRFSARGLERWLATRGK